MNDTQHIVIVGGGIVGVCTAYYLARRGCRVTVLERGQSSDSASAGNAGIVALGHLPLPRPGLARKVVRWMFDRDSPLYVPPRFDPGLWQWFLQFQKACTADQVDHCMQVLARLGQETILCWEDILSTESLDCDWHQSGWLDVYSSEAGRELAAEDAEVVSRFGFAVEPLDRDTLREREPAFGGKVLGAYHYAESAFLHPGRFLAGLQQCLSRRGAEIRPDTEVKCLLVQNGRCSGVELTTGEVVAADVVVLAAGVWSAHLAAAVGLRLPLQAGKGYHLDLTMPDPPLRTASVLIETSVAVTPMAETLRLAGTLEFSGVNLRLIARRLEMLQDGAKGCLPGVAGAEVNSRWCGLRPCTHDGLPVIGWAPGLAGLFLATGHAKLGLSLGPITGRLVSECMLGDEPSLDMTPLRADRF